MKKVSLAHKIRSFLWIAQLSIYISSVSLTPSVFAQSLPSSATGPSQNVSELAPTTSSLPKNYRLPEMVIPDSVIFNNSYRDQVGHRISVEGYWGRFGSTADENFKEKVYELQKIQGDQVRIILTLTSTLPDAEILQKKLKVMGMEAVILEIPDEYQRKILAQEDAKESGGLKELLYETREFYQKVKNPINTLQNSASIIKDQFVAPSKIDIHIASITTTFTLTTGTAVALASSFLLGVDPMLGLAITAARTFFTGTTSLFSRSFSNLIRADFSNDFKIRSTQKQIALKLTTFGLGMGEAYYALGTSISPTGYGISQSQLFTNTLSTGVVDSAASIERNQKLTRDSAAKWSLYSFYIGSLIGTFAMIGLQGPLVLESSWFKFTTIQMVSIVLSTLFLVSYKFKYQYLERLANEGFRKALAEIASAKYERLNAIKNWRDESRKSRHETNILFCSSLFK